MKLLNEVAWRYSQIINKFIKPEITLLNGFIPIHTNNERSEVVLSLLDSETVKLEGIPEEVNKIIIYNNSTI